MNWPLAEPEAASTVRMGSPSPGRPDWCYDDPSGVLTVDLSVTSAAGVMRSDDRAGSARTGACCPRRSSQSCPPPGRRSRADRRSLLHAVLLFIMFRTAEHAEREVRETLVVGAGVRAAHRDR